MTQPSPPSARPAAASGTFTLGGDLTVTRLGYGAMQITGPGIWGPPADPDGAVAVLRRAVELGVDFIDTADSYGPFVSEELIARALHPYDGVTIATKGGLARTGPDQWHPIGLPEYLTQCVEMSLRRLRVETIDLYQLHRVDNRLPLEDQVGALKTLQDAGKIRHIGLSEVSVAQLEAARVVAPIVSVQNLYNLGHRTAEDLVDALRARGHRVHPVVPVRQRHAGPPRRHPGRDGAHHRPQPRPAGPGLAAAPLAGHPADPRAPSRWSTSRRTWRPPASCWRTPSTTSSPPWSPAPDTCQGDDGP